MRNMGPKSSQWLAAIGIHTLDDLREVGVVTAYNLLRAHGHNATLNLVWAMQGALMDVHWSDIPKPVKQDLRQRIKQCA